MKPIPVILESGSKRTLAMASAWPGWCRSGRDEESALQALLDYAPRYARVMNNGGVKFTPPAGSTDFEIALRVKGNATTDFGAPAIIVDADREPVPSGEAKRWRDILQAAWQAFDRAAERASGKELRKGPRGGGRELEEIFEHVLGSDWEYLKRLAWTQKPQRRATAQESVRAMREDILRALDAAVREGVPAQGPRGGATWPPRYFVRRVEWHVIDHAWEIEDRAA
jgi:hypothetical protein